MRSVDYVILYATDLSRSIGFYRDLLGLELRFERDGYAEFDTGATRFGLFERSRLGDLVGEVADPGGPAGEVLFLVDDVDAEAERLRDAGVQILTGPVDRRWGHRTVHLMDPDGNVIELAQEIPRTDR